MRSLATRTLAALATLLALAAVFTAAPAANAATSHGHPAAKATVAVGGSHTSSHTVRPNDYAACVFNAEQPFKIVNKASAPIYAGGAITSCTTPPPDDCHLVVYLQQLTSTSSGTYFVDIAEQDLGWKPCSTSLYGNPSHKCISVAETRTFRTESTLAILFEGSSDSQVDDSPTAQFPCD